MEGGREQGGKRREGRGERREGRATRAGRKDDGLGFFWLPTREVKRLAAELSAGASAPRGWRGGQREEVLVIHGPGGGAPGVLRGLLPVLCPVGCCALCAVPCADSLLPPLEPPRCLGRGTAPILSEKSAAGKKRRTKEGAKGRCMLSNAANKECHVAACWSDDKIWARRAMAWGAAQRYGAC